MGGSVMGGSVVGGSVVGGSVVGGSVVGGSVVGGSVVGGSVVGGSVVMGIFVSSVSWTVVSVFEVKFESSCTLLVVLLLEVPSASQDVIYTDEETDCILGLFSSHPNIDKSIIEQRTIHRIALNVFFITSTSKYLLSFE